jgi:hypothetical protein
MLTSPADSSTSLTTNILETIIPSQYGRYSGEESAVAERLPSSSIPITILHKTAPSLTRLTKLPSISSEQMPTNARFRNVMLKQRFVR